MSMRSLMILNLVLAVALGLALGAIATSPTARSADALDYWGDNQRTVPLQIGGGVNGMSIPAQDWALVTPSDTVDLAYTPRAVYSNDGGVVQCRGRSGNVVPLTLAAGEIKPIRCLRIQATDTTSTEVWALY